MSIALDLSALALQTVLQGALQSCGLEGADLGSDKLVGFLVDRFRDQSQRLTKALHDANESAWRALEVALAGESMFSIFSRAEDRAFRQEIRAFLDGSAAVLPEQPPEFRKLCLRELKGARAAGLLGGIDLDPQRLARRVGPLARFSDLAALAAAEMALLAETGNALTTAGHPNLGRLVGLRPASGEPLLALAVRHYFRRAVERDRELFQGLTWAKLQGLQQDQWNHFDALAEVLAGHQQRLDEGIAALLAAAQATHAAVLDVHAEQQRHTQHLRELAEQVASLKEMQQRQKETPPIPVAVHAAVPVAAVAPPGPWRVGDRVMAARGDGYLYAGTVCGILGDYYELALDLGDRAVLGPDRMRSYDLTAGDAVFANWKGAGRYFRGAISHCRGNDLHVNYDDGDREWTKAAMLRVKDRSCPPDVRAWDRVLGRFGGGNLEYRGTVCFREGEQFEIEYDGGAVEVTTLDFVRPMPDDSGRLPRRPPARWRIGERVLACWTSGRKWWYPAVVAEVAPEQAGVRYDDGDETWVPADLVRAMSFVAGQRVYVRGKGWDGFGPASLVKWTGDGALVQLATGGQQVVPLRSLRVTPYRYSVEGGR